MNQSYWQKTATKRKLKKLNRDLNVDVLIIGAGFSGVMLAYQLKDSHLNIAVIDKNRIGQHTSGHTTAKLTILHDLIYQKLEQFYDRDHAYLYYQSNKEALQEIKDIIKKENIQCDFQENNAYIYSHEKINLPQLKKEKELLQSFGEDVIEINHQKQMIGLKHQAIFHPLKYLYKILSICINHDIQFFEQSIASKVYRYHDHYKVKVNNHYVTCQYVVHATRYPFIKKGFYFLKIFQTKEYITHYQKNESKDSFLSIEHPVSYRPLHNNSSLIIHPYLHDWFAQDSIPLRGIPYIGRLKDNEFMIYGFQKWGMTLSHVAAKLIRDLILNQKNEYKELYSCHYFSVSFSKQYLPVLLKNSFRGYFLQRYQIIPLNQLEKGQGDIIKINHHLYAVYRDDHGFDHYFSPYCPHLKCLIHFNAKSQTWDCPCHQSIYDAYGHLIEGPSVLPLKKIVNDEIH
ncbi:MAG: FAD-dependent oxidoreductase [Faecalibacillus sp.]